jgi:4'-phosphopantetheinyl transferase
MPGLYAVRSAEALDDEIFQDLLESVSPEKKERIGRFCRREDAQRSLLAELLIRHVLMNHLGLPNSALTFSRDERHKPYLEHAADLHFNLSHSGDWVACAIDRLPVGVDVERIRERDIEDLRDVFSREERLRIGELGRADCWPYFYSLWTLKESYVKALGKGLLIPPGSLSVKFCDDGEIVMFHEGRPVPRVFLRTYSLDVRHRMAACSFSGPCPEEVNRMDIREVIRCFEKESCNG